MKPASPSNPYTRLGKMIGAAEVAVLKLRRSSDPCAREAADILTAAIAAEDDHLSRLLDHAAELAEETR